MGIISWIKHKYFETRLQKANRMRYEGHVQDAIDILNSILDKHPDAPSILLSIYHSQIEGGNRAKVPFVTSLYKSYTSLADECVKFANSIASGDMPKIAIDYIQSLYCAGVYEIKSLFVTTSHRYVVGTPSVSNLYSLTSDEVLISALSDSLFNAASQLYRDNDLNGSKRICELISPVLHSKRFYTLYSNVRFDSLVKDNNIDAESIGELDRLFNDAKSKYNLSSVDLLHLTDKGLQVAQKSFNKNDLVTSLLVSQRLVDKYPQACTLYTDTALKLYQINNINKNLIVAGCLYKALGLSPSELIRGLELFIPYDIQYKEKYVVSAVAHLTHLLSINRYEAERLFFHAWNLVPDQRLLECVLSNGPEEDRGEIVTKIIDRYDRILTDDVYLITFVTCLKRFSNLNYIADCFEILLSRGVKVEDSYRWAILQLALAAPVNSRNRIEILTRGLELVQAQEFIDKKGDYLKDYILKGAYDKEYVLEEIKTLKNKHSFADVLVAYILIEDAENSHDNQVKEQKLREALTIRTSHGQPFDKSGYDALLPKIISQLTQLAESLYCQDKDRAIAILYLLRDNQLEWYDSYASLFLNSISSAQPSPELASSILEVIEEGYESIITAALWERYVNVQIPVANNLPLDEAIEYLMTVRVNINNTCNLNNIDNIITSVDAAICKQLMERGKIEEKNNNFDKAISDYKSAISIFSDCADAEARIYICKLKAGQNLSDADNEDIGYLMEYVKDQRCLKDLAFRWCIYLILHDDLNKAEEVNTQILGCDLEIMQICQEEKIKAQQKILDKLNNQIIRLNNSELTAEEAISFGKSLTRLLREVSFIVNVSPQKIRVLKESIRVFAIEKFYENGEYLDSLQGLKVQDSTYLSDPVALRNIAIMALMAAENNLLSENNYKELLSVWATAIYQQKLFVDSLDYTTWDDPYVFTLKDALGHLNNNDSNLPDNVNYDDPNESNVVSILEVQKSLLLRMEVAVQDNLEYQTFLSSQLEAMDKLASQGLDEDCVIVAPYLLVLSDTYKSNVFNALTIEESRHYGNWEEILDIGCRYGLLSGEFGRYSLALSNLKTAMSAMECRSQITSFPHAEVAMIRVFSGLMSQLVSTVTNAINDEISAEANYMSVYTLYGEVVKTLGDDSVAFIFSNYINQQVVRNLNEELIRLADGAKVLFDIYGYCRCNPHLKKNLENIIEALIHNYITDGEEKNLQELDRILSITREFDQCVVKALKGGDSVPEDMLVLMFLSNEARFTTLNTRIASKSQIILNQFASTAKKCEEVRIRVELNKIVEEVNSGSKEKCNALHDIYAIYRSNCSNEHVCKTLASLIPICIMEYIVTGRTGQNQVEYVLNSLEGNMSPTYHAHSSPVREAYNMIWNELPAASRHVLSAPRSYSLTEEGLRLKKALNYLQKLK